MQINEKNEALISEALKRISRDELKEYYIPHTKYETCNYFNITMGTLNRLLKVYDIKKPKIETELTLEEKSYIYGLLITDGTLSLKNKDQYTGQIQLEVNKRDEDIVDKLCNIIPCSTKRERIRNTNFSTNYHSVSFNIARQYFIKDIIDFGFPIENKTINARPPVVEYDKNAFWRGVLDGDGSLGMTHSSHGGLTPFLSLTTKSEQMKDAFCEYLRSITGHTYNPKRNKRDGVYNFGCGSNSACKVLKKVYENCTIYLDRKYNKYLECLQWEIDHKLMDGKPRIYYPRIVTVETREKLRKAAKERLSIPANNPMYGKNHSEETKQKIRDANKKRWEDEEYRRSASESRKGKHTGSDNHKARQIIQLSLDNAFVKDWGCIKEAAAFYHVSESCIRACCGGKQKTPCGFKWMYKEDYEEWIKNNVL